MRFFRHGRMEKNCVPDSRLHISSWTAANRTVHISLPYGTGRKNFAFWGNNLMDNIMQQGNNIIFTFKQNQTLNITMKKQNKNAPKNPLLKRNKYTLQVIKIGLP